MASESGAEARSDDRDEDAVDPRDAAARAIHDGADSGQDTRPWDPKFGPCPARTHLWKESFAGAWGPRLGVRPSIGRSSRTNLRLSPHFKHLHPLPQLRKVPRRVLRR